MLTATLRTGPDLSSGEKTDIINRMFAAQNQQERDSVRAALVEQYRVSEGTITSLIAHETMRKSKGSTQVGTSTTQDLVRVLDKSITTRETPGETLLPEVQEASGTTPVQAVQETTQAQVYTITSLVGILESMRANIIDDFSGVIQNSVGDPSYDFYEDIELISDEYSIDPYILEQFLRNKYIWLGDRLDALKNGRVLSEEDKMFIRIYVSEGADEKDRKRRRKEMVKKYGVSIKVIGPVTAWKLDGAGGVVLKKDGFGNSDDTVTILVGQTSPLNPSQELDLIVEKKKHEVDIGIRPVVADAGIQETSIEKTLEGEESFSDDDIAFIQELAGSFDLNNDEQRKLFLDDVFDLFPDSTITDVKKVISDFPDDVTHANAKRNGEGMGALINYNNEIKNKWREKLKQFIDENTDKGKRATMKVLCLPGMECLEIPLYIELGFRPENIVGVEAGIVQGRKDPEVIAKFQAKAAEYGIQTRIGRLEKILETEDTVFDVVSLDFLGPIGANMLREISKVKLGKSPIILINYQGKREMDFAQRALKRAHISTIGGGRVRVPGYVDPETEAMISSINISTLGNRDESFSVIMSVLSTRLYGDNIRGLRVVANLLEKTFTGARINEFFDAIKYQFELPPGLRYEDIDFEKRFEESKVFINLLLSKLFQLFFDQVTPLIQVSPEEKDRIRDYFWDLLGRILHYANSVKTRKSFMYTASNTKMLSDFIAVERFSEKDFLEFKDTIFFIFLLINKIIDQTIARKIPRNIQCIYYNSKYGYLKVPISKNDTVIFQDDEGNEWARIKVATFFNDLFKFQKYGHRKLWGQKKSREKIS